MWKVKQYLAWISDIEDIHSNIMYDIVGAEW